MATQQEITQRHSIIRGWLETGAPVASVATMATVRFSYSRSSAYEDIKTVQAAIDKSPDGPSLQEQSEPLDPDGILAMLQHQFSIAAAEGDVGAMAKLVGAIDKAKKWRGMGQEGTGRWA
jgi:hypothetical protein